ncbi:hypothetical protein EU642_22160 [Salmonella enterica]|nr:hypothetical protein [Salmonella enterica]EAO0118559.1 hypothetical protein [Salmonella enterica]EAO3601663.1 hypothetical protein [Salmonella enterica]EAR6391557.1 hypothetical protein [Salmonella enterica]EAV1285321.1 hypothetical protein [Salmonella enterica]
MKRTIIATTMAFAALGGTAHADRNTSVNLRVTEVMIPLAACAERNGEASQQVGSDMIEIRPSMETAFGQLYDLGALAKERGIDYKAHEVEFMQHMRSKMDSEGWAEPLNAAERSDVARIFAKVVQDGFEGN